MTESDTPAWSAVSGGKLNNTSGGIVNCPADTRSVHRNRTLAPFTPGAAVPSMMTIPEGLPPLQTTFKAAADRCTADVKVFGIVSFAVKGPTSAPPAPLSIT